MRIIIDILIIHFGKWHKKYFNENLRLPLERHWAASEELSPFRVAFDERTDSLNLSKESVWRCEQLH